MRMHGRAQTREEEHLQRPLPGESALVTLGLAIGILFMTIQLWLLTLAFDLYLSGERGETIRVAIISGLVFLLGLVMLRLLNRRPARIG